MKNVTTLVTSCRVAALRHIKLTLRLILPGFPWSAAMAIHTLLLLFRLQETLGSL